MSRFRHMWSLTKWATIWQSKRSRWIAVATAVLVLVAIGCTSVLLWRDHLASTGPHDVDGTDAAFQEPVRVLFVGDSLTYGSYATTTENTFRSLVLAALPDRSRIDTNFVGGPGQSSADVGRAITGKTYEYVIVEVGTNDATKEPQGSFDRNYPALMTSIRKASPKAKVVCVGSWLGAPAATRIDPVITSSCQAAGGAYVGVDDLYRDSANKGPAGRKTVFGLADDYHPNDEGHRQIAARIVQQLSLPG